MDVLTALVLKVISHHHPQIAIRAYLIRTRHSRHFTMDALSLRYKKGSRVPRFPIPILPRRGREYRYTGRPSDGMQLDYDPGAAIFCR